MKIMKRKAWIIPVVILLIAGGWFVLKTYGKSAQPAAASNLQVVSQNLPSTGLNAASSNADSQNAATTVDATGSVRTKQTATLSWQAAGTVGSVQVKAGDTIKAGQVLATLSQNSLPASIITAQSSLLSDQQALDNLLQSNTPQAQAKVNALNATQTYTDTLTTQQNLVTWTSQPAYLSAQAKVQIAQDALNSARSKYNQVSKTASSSANTSGGTSAGSTSGSTNSQSGSSQSDTKRSGGRPGRGGTGSQSSNPLAQATRDLRVAHRHYLRAQNQLDLLGVPTSYELDVAAAKTALSQAQLQDAQNQLAKVINGPNPEDVAAAKAKVQADQAVVNQASVIAPFSGTITEVTVKPGDVVSGGTSAFQLDDTSSWYVDLQVSEVDINNVKIGQTANVTFDAVPNKQYSATVISISPTGVSNNGAIFFTVTVQLTNIDTNIKPGMTASASINTK